MTRRDWTKTKIPTNRPEPPARIAGGKKADAEERSLIDAKLSREGAQKPRRRKRRKAAKEIKPRGFISL